MNIEQEIWNDFKELSESKVKKRLEWCEQVSLGLNKRLEFDEDFRINKYLASVEIENIDWGKLKELYPKREPIQLPTKVIYPIPKFRSKKEWHEINSYIIGEWDKRKIELYDKIPSEAAAKDYLISVRWADGIICPFCGSEKVYIINIDMTPYKCSMRTCRQKFNVRIDTIFENTKLPLLKWYEAMYLLTSLKTKGISTPQLASVLSVTQKTAWMITHKIKSKIDDDFIKLIRIGLFKQKENT
jgi:transposase-like protein